MSFFIKEASATVCRQRLEALSAILDKAAAYAKDRKIEPSTLIQARLFPDMVPLGRQCRSRAVMPFAAAPVCRVPKPAFAAER